MQKVKVLIVEDNQLTAESIAVLLEEMQYDVVGVAIDASEAKQHLQKDIIDIALIDINLADDLHDRSGIALGKLLKEKYHIPFLYLTGYSDASTIIKAKQTQPQAYLIKPIKKKELYANIEIALTHTDECIYVKDGYYQVKIILKDILWVQANGNFVKIYTSPKKFYIAKMTMNEMEQKLTNHHFLRIHKSYIVNTAQVTKYKSDSLTIAEVDFNIGRAYQKDVKAKLSS